MYTYIGFMYICIHVHYITYHICTYIHNIYLYMFLYIANYRMTDIHSKNKTQLIATDGYMLLKKPKFIVLKRLDLSSRSGQ